jgi:DNA-directed RNA polymerase alpha subunit
MPTFLLEHLNGCTPLEPCASCKAAAFLRSKLGSDDFAKLQEISRESSLSLGAAAADDAPISVLEPLPTRLRAALRNDNIKTIGDVCKKTEAEIMRTPNIARASLNYLKSALQRVGRKLSESDA